jgi:hypothetical protein
VIIVIDFSNLRVIRGRVLQIHKSESSRESVLICEKTYVGLLPTAGRTSSCIFFVGRNIGVFIHNF